MPPPVRLVSACLAGVPCRYDGRAIGIIDFSQSYTSVLDAVALLETGAPEWTRADRKAMGEWNGDFLGWLRDSDFGQQEAAAANNHGTFYDMLVAGLAYAMTAMVVVRG